jgi:hypothetical protein
MAAQVRNILDTPSYYGPVDMIYLTAIGLTPGGSSTHLHTKQHIEQHNQTIHRTTHYRHKQYMEQYNSRMFS